MLRMLEKYFEPTVIVTTLGAIIVFVFADVVARFAFSTSISVAWSCPFSIGLRKVAHKAGVNDRARKAEKKIAIASVTENWR